METNEKLMTLLRLMDEPEAMTDEQLEELLADDEVRNAYNLMADCKKLYKRNEEFFDERSGKAEHSSLPKGFSLFTLHFKKLPPSFSVQSYYVGWRGQSCPVSYLPIRIRLSQHRQLLPSLTRRGKGVGHPSASTTCASTAFSPSCQPTMARL